MLAAVPARESAAGAISPAVCNLHKETTPGYGFDISKDTFGTSVDWKHAAAAVRAKLKKHGDFVIVEATRSPSGSSTRPTAYGVSPT